MEVTDQTGAGRRLSLDLDWRLGLGRGYRRRYRDGGWLPGLGSLHRFRFRALFATDISLKPRHLNWGSLLAEFPITSANLIVKTRLSVSTDCRIVERGADVSAEKCRFFAQKRTNSDERKYPNARPKNTFDLGIAKFRERVRKNPSHRAFGCPQRHPPAI
jgi:hypothetical protein